MNRHTRRGNYKKSKTFIIFTLMTALDMGAQNNSVSWHRNSESIPHGSMHHHIYTTAVAINLPSEQEDFYVYTPPGYDPKSPTKYPVLYLLHGDLQDASAWSKNGGANLVLDELIARGKARPMIVVMPHGYGNYKFFLGGKKMWGFPILIDQNVNLFSKMLLTEIIPRIESDYKVSTKRKDHAIAGLSLGGREAITIGLENPSKFSWIGGFSAAFPAALPRFERERIADIDPETADLRLLWISCGISDPYVPAGNKRLIAQLKKDNLPVTAVFTPGAHDWPVWRYNFKQFVSQLF